ncbi:hypothetical protein [Natronoglycomyces albus]|uniref:Uncharacterized protein n=1 Tax=Natronoglycomyces albus TaxID=2811108 RepID=A0A895XML8_9ACTN|nr:hypothetical protein [Natronoglycomyces albus]QSB04783.1 hypothetical protein JQS30_13575 [Natronoglycomyces albus]
MSVLDAVQGLSHREAAGRLLADGWNVCGVGDWATVWRSPDGAQVARVSPFELAYGVFVELCRRLEGHPLLPRVDVDVPLRGGGRLTAMEFLLPVEREEAAAVIQRWDTVCSGDPITQVRVEAERLDAEAASAIPYWGGLDLNRNNVMKDASGQFKLVDLFFAEGAKIYRLLRNDPAQIAARFTPDQREYMCEIAFIARQSTPEEMAQLRAGAERIA